MDNDHHYNDYSNFTQSQKALVLKKSYDDIFVTVIIELPKDEIKNKTRKMAVDVLRDDLINLLNDKELGNLLKNTINTEI